MNKTILTLALLFITVTGFSQTSQTRYFSDKNLTKEATPEKAKFKQTATRLPDGAVSVEVVNMKNNEVISTVAYKGEEPVGVWKYPGLNMSGGLDYSFELIYSDASCNDTIAGLRNYSEDNVAYKYNAPKIANEKGDLGKFLAKNLRYPDMARENNIQGRVLLALRVSAKGKVENIVVKKGVHVSLDKEAVRVFRQLTFSTPPMHNGKPVDICMVYPVSFRLE